MDRIFNSLSRLGVDFASVRHETTRGLTISMLDGILKVDVNDSMDGYMLKVLSGGSYSYRSIVKEPTVEDIRLAKAFGPRNGADSAPEIKPIEDTGGSIEKDMEEKIRDVQELRKRIMDHAKKIKTLTVTYSEKMYHKEYADSHGSRIVQDFPRSILRINAVAKEGNDIATAIESNGTNRGYIFDIVNQEEILRRIKNKIDSQLHGGVPKSGEYEVILGPDATGTFCHEAFGHLAEGDLAQAGFLLRMKGQKVADSTVSIVDYPVVPDALAAGFTMYDDEGVKGRAVDILKKGVVNEFMTNLHFAGKFGTAPTGNARAQDFNSPDIVRMRNTCIKKGEVSKEELISSVKKGYLILSPHGGTTTSEGTFQFGVGEGYRIENGEVKEGLKLGVGMSGYALKTLALINGVSKEFGMSSGLCGKCGQWAPVSDGGPYIRVRKLKVGGHA